MARSRYPSLQVPASAPPDLRAFLEGVKERLEITTGDRGDPRDRQLTVRDVETAGMATVTVRNKYATLSGGITAASAASLMTGSGDGDFEGVSVATLEQIQPGFLEAADDFLIWDNAVSRLQRVPYNTLRASFLTSDADAEIPGYWQFQNEELALEIAAETPRFRYTEIAESGETLPADSSLWDWYVDDQQLVLALLSDDESTSTSFVEFTRDGDSPASLALKNGAVLQVQDGTLAEPGLAFDVDLDTGLRRISANRFGLIAGATLALDVAGSALGFPNGTAGAPGLYPQGSPTTGIYRAASDVLAFSVATTERLRLLSTGASVTGTVLVNAATGHIDLTPSAAADFAALKFRNNAGTEIWRLNSEVDGDLDFSRQSGTGVLRVNTVNVNDAALFTTGTLDDARLSSNVPLKNTANTFALTNTFTLTPVVPDSSWTYAKLQNVSATARVLGRVTAGAGVIEELTASDIATLISYTAADVLAKLLTVDGTGSLLDADLLDGVQGSDYARLSVGNNFTSGTLQISGATPFLQFTETDQASVDEQIWGHLVNGKIYSLNSYVAGFGANRQMMAFTRGTGTALSSIAFGNATDNATVSFAGTGLVSIGGGLTVTGTVTVPNTSFTYAKLQNVSATSRVLGRITAGAGVIEELTAANIATIITYTAADVLAKLLTVDGSGSTLDADLLDGIDSLTFAQRTSAQTITGAWNFTTKQQVFGATTANIALVPGLADSGAAIHSYEHIRNHRVAAEPFWISARVNGSYAAPTAILSGDSMGEFFFGGYDGTTMQVQSGRIHYAATENWAAGSANGGQLLLSTTTTGTTTRVTRAIFGGNSTGGYAQFPNGAVGQPGIAFASDNDNGFYLSNTNEVSLATAGVQRLQVNGTAVQAAVPFRAPDGLIGAPSWSFSTSPTTGVYLSASNEMTLGTANVRRVVFDASGRSLFGSQASSVQIGSLTATTIQVGAGTGAGLSVSRYSNDTVAPVFVMGKSRDTTVGAAATAVQSGDNLARWQFAGADGTNMQTVAAGVYVVVAGAVSTGVVPGEMQFYTSTTGGVFTEAMRLTAGGTALYRDGTVALPSVSLLNDPDCGLYRVTTNSIALATNAVLGLGIDASQRVYGSALHNNASSPTGTTNQYIASGTYTPTLTNTTNVAASTAFQCQWMRVGNVVTVSGRVSVDPTAAGATVLGISLPIASNIGAVEDCAGTAFANAVAGQGAAIWGDATNDRASMEWVAVDVTNQGMSFTFTYEII